MEGGGGGGGALHWLKGDAWCVSEGQWGGQWEGQWERQCVQHTLGGCHRGGPFRMGACADHKRTSVTTMTMTMRAEDTPLPNRSTNDNSL